MNVTPSLNQIIEWEEKEYNLANYNFFFENVVSQSVETEFRTLIKEFLDINESQFIVEGRYHLATKIQSSGKGALTPNSWIELDLISLRDNELPMVNIPDVTKGRIPSIHKEILIQESLALIDGLKINDEIILYGPSGPVTFTIVGLVKSIEYSSYSLSQTGVVYTNYNGISDFFQFPVNGSSFNSFVVYLDDEYPIETLRVLYSHLVENLSVNPLVEEPVIFVWFTQETSFRKGMQDALKLTSTYLVAASLFIFLVAGVIIFVIMNRYITEQKIIIGAMYAYGTSKKQIVYSFFLRIFILSIFAISIGLYLGKILLEYLVSRLVNQWGLLSTTSDISASSILIVISIGTIMAYGSTFLSLYNVIRLTPYEAMRGTRKDLKNHGVIFYLTKFIPAKVLKHALRNLTRNKTRSYLTIAAFTISIAFSGSLIYTDVSVDNTIDDYFAKQINYDLELNLGFENAANSTIIHDLNTLDINSDNIPDISEFEFFLSTISPFADKPEKLTFLMGLYAETTMFEFNQQTVTEGNWIRENSNDIVISRYVAGTLGVDLHSDLSIILLGSVIRGKVVGIMNELMLNSVIIMDISFLTTQVSRNSNLPIANKALIKLQDDIEISVFQNYLNQDKTYIWLAVTKDFYNARMVALSKSQTVIILLLISLGYIVGLATIFTTLLISIAERQRELSLLNVFGFYRTEILLELILEGMIIGGISLFLGLIISGQIASNLWIPLLSRSLIEITITNPTTEIVLVSFLSITLIILSIVVNYISTTEGKMVVSIRQE